MGERLRVRGNGQRGDGGGGGVNLFARFFRIAGERRVVKTGVKFAKIPIHKDSLLIQDRIIIPDFRKRCNPMGGFGWGLFREDFLCDFAIDAERGGEGEIVEH